jgi:DNA repair ATPase RecN
MEIRERIAQCLTTLDARRQMIRAFETRVKGVIDALKKHDDSPASVGEMLGVLEEVLRSYREISQSCTQMIDGLTEVGLHVEKIEEGRTKIVGGVEAILQKLSQLEALAAQGIQVGVNGPEARPADHPRRVLLIRIRPESGSDRKAGSGEASTAAEPDLDSLDVDDSTVH